MKPYLNPQRVENELILQQRDIRYIRATRKAIAMLNSGHHTWGYDSGRRHDLLVEVWRWHNAESGFTVRLVDTRTATRNTVYDDVSIAFYDCGKIEILPHNQ